MNRPQTIEEIEAELSGDDDDLPYQPDTLEAARVALSEAARECAANAWLIIETDSFPHVVPYQDLKEHDVDDICWCRPYEDDGVIVHNSMDKRERYERGEMMQI